MDINRRRLAVSTLAYLHAPDLPQEPVITDQQWAHDGIDHDFSGIYEAFRIDLHKSLERNEQTIAERARELEEIADDIEHDYEVELDLFNDLGDEEPIPLPPPTEPADISREAIRELREQMDELAGKMRRAVIYAAVYEDPRITQAELARIAGVSHVTIGRWLAHPDDQKRVRRTVHERATDVASRARAETIEEKGARAAIARTAQRCEDAARADQLSDFAYVPVHLDFFIATFARGALTNREIVDEIAEWVAADDETVADMPVRFELPQSSSTFPLLIPRKLYEKLRSKARARGVQETEAISQALIARLAKRELAGSPLFDSNASASTDEKGQA